MTSEFQRRRWRVYRARGDFADHQEQPVSDGAYNTFLAVSPPYDIERVDAERSTGDPFGRNATGWRYPCHHHQADP